VHTFRNGRTPRTISSSTALLVTHNYALFKASARFFNQRRDGKSVPHCVYDATFTTLVWLHEPKQFPDLPRETILADAAAALQPSDSLWRAYNEAVQAQLESDSITDDDARFLRYSEDAKRLLMDLTKGRPDGFTEGTLPELLELYRQGTVREERAETQRVERHLSEETAARETAEESAESARRAALHVRLRVSDIASTTAWWIATGVSAALFVLLAAGTVLAPVGPIDNDLPPFLRYLIAAVVLAIGIWANTASGSLRTVRDRFATWGSGQLEGLFLKWLKLSPNKEPTANEEEHVR